MIEAKQHYLHLTQPNSDTSLSLKLRDSDGEDLIGMNKISERHVPFSSLTSSPGDTKQFLKEQNNANISIKQSDILQLSLFNPLKLVFTFNDEPWGALHSNIKRRCEGETSIILEDDDKTTTTLMETSISVNSSTQYESDCNFLKETAKHLSPTRVYKQTETSCDKEDLNSTTSKSLEETKTSGISVDNVITSNSHYSSIQDILFDDLSLANKENKQQSDLNKFTIMLNDFRRTQRKPDINYEKRETCVRKEAVESRRNEVMENSSPVRKLIQQKCSHTDLRRCQHIPSHMPDHEFSGNEESTRFSEIRVPQRENLNFEKELSLTNENQPYVLISLKERGSENSAKEVSDTVDICDIPPSKSNITSSKLLEYMQRGTENSTNEECKILTKKVASTERSDENRGEGKSDSSLDSQSYSDTLSEGSQKSESRSAETKMRHSKSSQTENEAPGSSETRDGGTGSSRSEKEDSQSNLRSEKERSLSSEDGKLPLQDFDSENNESRSAGDTPITGSSRTPAGFIGGAQRDCVQSVSSDTIRDPLSTLDSQSDHSEKENDNTNNSAVESLENMRNSQSVSSGSRNAQSSRFKVESDHSFCSEETLSTDIVQVHNDTKISLSPSGDVVLCIKIETERTKAETEEVEVQTHGSENEDRVPLSPRGHIEYRESGNLQEMSTTTSIDEEIRVFITDCFAPKKPPLISKKVTENKSFDEIEKPKGISKGEDLKDVFAEGSFPKVSKRLEMMLRQPEIPEDDTLKLSTIFEQGGKKALLSTEEKTSKDVMFKSLQKDLSHNKQSNVQGGGKPPTTKRGMFPHFKHLKPRRDSLSLFAEKSILQEYEYSQEVSNMSKVNVYNLNYISPTFADIVRSPSFCKVKSDEVYSQLVPGAGDADAFPAAKPVKRRLSREVPFLINVPRNLPSNIGSVAPCIGSLRRLMREIESPKHCAQEAPPQSLPLDTPWWRSTPALFLHSDKSTNTVSSEEPKGYKGRRYVPSTTSGDTKRCLSWVWRRRLPSTPSQVPSTTSTSSQTLFPAPKASPPPPPRRALPVLPPCCGPCLPPTVTNVCACQCAASVPPWEGPCGGWVAAGDRGPQGASERRRAYAERREKLRREERQWRKEEREWLRRMRARQKAVGAAEAAMRAQIVSSRSTRRMAASPDRCVPIIKSLCPRRQRSTTKVSPFAGVSVSVPCVVCRVPCAVAKSPPLRRVCGNAASAPALCVTVRPVAAAGKR